MTRYLCNYDHSRLLFNLQANYWGLDKIGLRPKNSVLDWSCMLWSWSCSSGVIL